MGAAAKKLDLEPKPELLSITAIGKRCGIHRETCRNRLDDLGYTPDEEHSTRQKQLYWFDDEMEFAIKSAKDTLSAMKIRQLRAAAEKIEMQNAQARGELVSMNETVEIIQKIVGTLYQEYVQRQPKRIGTKLAKAKSVPAVKKILRLDSDRIMKQLRANFERFIG